MLTEEEKVAAKSATYFTGWINTKTGELWPASKVAKLRGAEIIIVDKIFIQLEPEEAFVKATQDVMNWAGYSDVKEYRNTLREFGIKALPDGE